MSHGQLATAGVALSVAGIALGQLWLVAGVLLFVSAIAFVIRYSFRRGRTPEDI
jgi:hypothetical protein